MKHILLISVLLVLTLSVQISAQLVSIKEFPRAYESQEIKELTPVWISGNEILVFYKNATYDTIFSRRTTNRGKTWSQQKFERSIEASLYYLSDMYLYKTLSGRILFFFQQQEEFANIICSYSDDDGFSWTDVEINAGIATKTDFSILELDEGKIVLSFSQRFGTRLSTDNGESWTDENYYNVIPLNPFSFDRNPHLIKLTENGDFLLGFYTESYGYDTTRIYITLSTDAGASWSDPNIIWMTRMYNLIPVLPTLKAVQDRENNIWLVFDSEYELENIDYSQTDVSVLFSSDSGQSWIQKDNFTSYMGNDFLTGVTTDGENILAFFNSARNDNYYEGYFGIVGQSLDTFTPPVLLSQEVTDVNYETEEFDYRALVIDDDAVSKVYVDLEYGVYQGEMFDDGMHNDSLANDNIFGTKLPLITPANGNEAYLINTNKLTLPFNSKGVLADVNIGGDDLSVEIKATDISQNTNKFKRTASIPSTNGGSGGKFEEGNFLFSGGFFLSGYSNGEMWSNGVASASLVEDYFAGKVGSDPKDDLNRIYIISKEHLPFGYAWQNWKNAVSLGAEFYDGDGDGIYNPVDKNWNGTWDINEDMPPIIGDEIAWCVYNDGQNVRRWETVDPQGIEVRQTIFTSNDSELENVIFIRYSILNTGLVADVMDSVYFGIWEDADLGDNTDDVVGCDTLLNSGFYYNNTYDYVFGENPPAFYSTYLQGPISFTNNPSDTAKTNFGQQIGSVEFPNSKNLDVSSHIFFIGGDPNLNDPSTAVEARNYILGKDRLGNYINPCTFAYGQVKGGVNCNEVNPRFWFSGDPVTNVGWLCKWGRDMRNLVSTGPFNLEKDKPQEIIIAYIIGRGTDPINSISVARENVQRAIEEYESNFATMTYTPPPATNPIDSYVLYQNYPNPFNPVTTIRYELPQDGQVTIDIFDILGQRVGTIVNEYKKADRYEVTFSSTGLASGVYVYQLRVNDFITSKKMVLLR